MVLQPVLPEKWDFVKSSRSVGLLPAAVSEASTGCRNQGPPKEVVSGGAGAAVAVLTVSEGSLAGFPIGDWQATRRKKQAAAMNFLVIFLQVFKTSGTTCLDQVRKTIPTVLAL